jgi:hypothetical protein
LMRFIATKEQEQVRKSARSLYDSGMCMVGDWVRRIPSLTMKKWGIWEKTEGFMEWWIELFPEHAGVTVTDLRALEFEAARALMKAVTEGDLQATKVVIGMVSTAKEAQGIGDKSMDEWFSPPEDNGWEKEWN